MIEDFIDIGKSYEFSPIEGCHVFIGKVEGIRGSWLLVRYQEEGVAKTSLINTDNITLITQVQLMQGGNK